MPTLFRNSEFNFDIRYTETTLANLNYGKEEIKDVEFIGEIYDENSNKEIIQ